MIYIVFFLLQVKHLIVDWCWQPPYEFMNKGTYGHWGGIRHALKNALGTALVVAIVPLFFLEISLAIAVAIFTNVLFYDLIIHYHIDWAKMNLNRHYGLEPTKHENFWRLTGLDQFLHQVTYIAIVFGVFHYIEKL